MNWSREGGISAVHETYDRRQLLLVDLPPTHRQTRVAFGIVVALLVAFCVTAPFANVKLWRVDAFIPILAATILIASVTTSALLFSQFYIVRRRALLVLASSYFFAALIVVPYALTFPGSFAPTGLLGAGLQTTAWLYTCWHVGPPLALIVYALSKDTDSKASMSQRAPFAAIGLSIAAVIVMVCGLTWAALKVNGILPTIVLDRDHLNRSAISLIGGLVMLLDASAFALLWRRRRSVLDLWLMVMCCAWFFVATMAVTLIGSRFSLGWYAGRIFEVIATFVVFLVLLSEMLALYTNLARSIMRQRNDRQARQIAMDVMAASIVHEINQPLAAMENNASAGLRWLNRATPDLDEVRAGLTRIVSNIRRVNEIVGSARSMFKKGNHGLMLLDVNDLVRETLTMLDLDLQTQRVSVTTDLCKDLAELSGDRGQLQQVFLNLIVNSIEAMSSINDRARMLRIRSNVIQGSSDVVVTVEDSGIGIGGEGSDRIFEPFFTTKSTGTGVGLTICHMIIEAHGGNLRASANKPFGAIFQVTLPSGDL
jgi:signal transduction histidine kinase